VVKLVAEAQGQFGNLEEEEHLPLECYQTTTGDDTAGWEDSVCYSELLCVCELATAL
jgi:hypothetical protein